MSTVGFRPQPLADSQADANNNRKRNYISAGDGSLSALRAASRPKLPVKEADTGQALSSPLFSDTVLDGDEWAQEEETKEIASETKQEGPKSRSNTSSAAMDSFTGYIFEDFETPLELSNAEAQEFYECLVWLEENWLALMRRIELRKGVCLVWMNRVDMDIQEARDWFNNGHQNPQDYLYWDLIVVLGRFLNPTNFKGAISLTMNRVDAILRELEPHMDVLGLPSIKLPLEENY